jgi:IPT/TIG domain
MLLKRKALTSLLPVLALAAVLLAALLAPSRPFGVHLAACVGYGYTYGGGPTVATVSNVSPNTGTTGGGTVVFITGSGYCNTVSAVSFGATAATSFSVLTDTEIKATSPAHAAGLVNVTVTNGPGTSATSAADDYTFVSPAPSVYTALTPQRILDTRGGGTLGQGGSVNLAIGGIYVPANATSVILNVTAVDTTTAGFFTVYPTGGSAPTASNLNWVAGETVPNLVSVGLSNTGSVTIFNGLGSADAVVDLQGYFAPPTTSTAGEFVPIVPTRVTDTRAASGQTNHGMTLGAGTTLKVTVTGTGTGVPFAGVSAVVLNVTAADQTANGFFTVYPTGAALPTASNLNWTPGVPVPNRVIVPVGTGGQVSIYNGLGSADAIVDVNGYITDSTAVGAVFSPLFPTRIKDTRGGPGPIGAVAAGSTTTVQVSGNGGVPAGSSAVIINVTVANPTAAGDLVVWPAGATQPLASDLNFLPGQTVPNQVVVKLSAGGAISIFSPFGTTNIIIDVVGEFT